MIHSVNFTATPGSQMARQTATTPDRGGCRQLIHVFRNAPQDQFACEEDAVLRSALDGHDEEALSQIPRPPNRV